MLSEAFVSRQFATFVLTGGIAAGVNFSSRIVYNQWLDFSTSIILAFVTGMLTAFILMRTFVFEASEQRLQRSLFFFTSVNMLGLAQTWSISIGLRYAMTGLGMTFFVKEIAHMIGLIVPVFTSYIFHKRWSFGKTFS